jgi:hypothetical protein
MIDICTLAWPCVGIHHGLDNCGGRGMGEMVVGGVIWQLQRVTW